MLESFKYIVRIGVLAFLLFSALDVNAGDYRCYDVKFGLSENNVLDIFQSDDGYMWLATRSGLNRCSGTRVDVFKSNLMVGVESICQAKDKDYLWVAGTNLILFNRNTTEFEVFSATTEDGIAIADPHSLCLDDNGVLWVAANTGLFSWDGETLVCHDKNFVNVVFIDSEGILWVGSRFSPGIKRYSVVNNVLTDWALPKNINDIRVNAYYESSDGYLWVGTTDGRLLNISRSTASIKELPTLNSAGKKIQVTRIHTIFEIDRECLMVGADNGLWHVNLETGVWSKDNSRLANESIYKIYRDYEGGIWIGSYFGGVFYTSPKQSKIDLYLDDGSQGSLRGNAVSELCEDAAGNLWIATENGGLNYLDRATDVIHDYTSYAHTNLHALMLDGRKLWIGTFDFGIDVLDVVTWERKRYRNFRSRQNVLPSNRVYSIFKSKSGTIYIGTAKGLCTYDEQTDTFVANKELDNYFIIDIAQDKAGGIWVVTRQDGIWRLLDGKWRRFKDTDFKPSGGCPRLHRAFIANDGYAWFCSEQDGIYRYDAEEDRFVNYFTEQGLPNTNYYGILEDENGYFWLSSNLGIVKYNYRNGFVRILTDEDGLQSRQFNPRSSIKTSDGKFWFGGINGLNSFYPLTITDDNIMPLAAIASVKMVGKSPTTESVEYRSMSQSELVVPRDVQRIEIVFDCLSFTAPHRNKYSWNLENMHEDWIVTEQNYASFMNLRHGHYKFKLKVCNGDGYWSDTIIELPIYVKPPLLLTPLFILLEMLVLLSVMFLALRLVDGVQKKRKEQELIQSKMVFFTQVAHEIKTPVSLISAPLNQIINEGGYSPDIETNLLVMKKNSDRLLQLVHQFLDYSKVDRDMYKLNITSIDMGMLIEECVVRFRPYNLNLAIKFVKPQEKVMFNVDPEAITKILSNLLTNALKYARNEISVNLSETENADKGRVLNLSVGNDGQPISKEILHKIFQPFYSHGNIEGFGIGLSLVKILVEKHSGSIVVDDNDGRGCRFIVSIPYIQLSENESASTAVAPLGNDSDKPLVLVVEDIDDMREFICNSLRHNFNVLSARNGAEALEVLQDNSCDLIICDLMMPVMDGHEFLKKLRASDIYGNIPCIILSAKDSDNVKIKSLEYGADAFIEKPFTVDHIRTVANNLIRSRKRMFEYFKSNPDSSAKNSGLRKYDEEWLEKLNEIITKNMADEMLDVNMLCEVMAVSRSNLQRRLKSITGTSPNDYIRLIRLKTAAGLLKERRYRVSEVCYIVGFNSRSYFSKVFYDQFGVHPKDYK